MSIFTLDEIEYLESGLLGRLATVDPDGYLIELKLYDIESESPGAE